MSETQATRAAERAKLILGLRQCGIDDPAVLDALERTPRELFVPAPFQHHAYDDSALPIARGQTISQPLVVAMMTEALRPDRRCKVLEVGTGSGYQAAILGLLSRRVYTIERHRPLLREAELLFRHLDRHNIVTKCGDGAMGWPGQAPFDRIMVTAAAPHLPEMLIGQLVPGGRIVVPVGEHGLPQSLILGVKTQDGLITENLGAVRFVPLLTGVEEEP